MTLDAAFQDLLSTHSEEQAARRVTSAPKGYEPGVAYEPDGSMTVTTPPMAELSGPDEWTDAVSSFIKIPDGYRAVLVEARYDPAAWTRDPGDKGVKYSAVTRPVWRYRFRIEPAASLVSADDLLAEISKWRPRKKELPTAPDNGLSFVVAVSDCQGGKSDGGGTKAMVESFMIKIDAAAERLKELRRLKRPIADAHLVFLGDMVEGFVSQGGANAWRTELTLTEQIRLYRRLALHAIKLLAPLVPRLVVVGIGGNHGETIRFPFTRYDDNHDIEVLVGLADALKDMPGFDHVSFVFPDKDEISVTLDLSGTITAFTHGHKYGAGQNSWEKWWSGQALGQQPVGDATILISGHAHHLKVIQAGSRTFLQAPALESESTWWKHSKGLVSPAGLMTLLIGGGSWQDLEVL